MPCRPLPLTAAMCCLVLLVTPALGAPRDAKVGDIRAVFARQGTPLRASPSALGAAQAMLPYGTQVRILEIQLPWMRVDAAGKTGWVKTWETVVPTALGQNPSPAHVTYAGQERVSAKDVGAAGRQLDAATERGYRTSRADLAAAYREVDAMEAATQALDPAEAVTFIVDGDLGRVGRDYARPGRVPAEPLSSSRRGPKNPGGLLGKLGGEVARRAGLGDTEARIAESLINSTTDYADQVAKKFTPQQEYFLGRAVAAQAIARHGIDKDVGRRRYVRLVGEALVRLSSRLPANFGGYHFDVLNTDDVNAVSGPGGFVLVTRGAVLACRTEAELAGVLAHELAHIRNGDGERLLRQSGKFPSMMKGLVNVAGAAAGAGGDAFAQGLVRFFSQAVDQVASTSIDHRYGKALESQADVEGTNILFDVFYDHDGLRSFLAHHAESRHGDTATHADPAERAAALAPFVASFKFPYNADEKTRAFQANRFRQATGATGN